MLRRPNVRARCYVPNLQTKTVINQTFVQAMNQIAGKGVPMPEVEIVAPVTDTCVEDNLFGGVTSIVRQMNINNGDLFEIIEAGSNPIERAALILRAIPIIETLPTDEIVEFTDQLIENIFEGYDAAYTTALEDEYRCDIFCLALDAPDCAVTFDMLFEYFSNRLGGSITIESILAEGIAFIAAGTWSGTEIVDAMMLAQVVLWRAASNFLGVNIRTLQTVGLLGQNNPDHDWSLLCDCGWSWTFPTDSAWTSWTLNTLSGATTTIADNKLVGAQSTTTVPTIFLDAQITVDADVDSVSFNIEYRADGNPLIQQAIIQLDGADVASVVIPSSTTPGTITVSWSTGATGSHTYRIVSGIYGTVAAGDYLRATASTWTGSGDNPFD